MKIALVIERMDPSRGGCETATGQIAEGLTRAGHEVTILCQKAKWEHEGVKICQLGRRGWPRVRRLQNFVSQVQGIIQHSDYDIVHTALPVPGANVYQAHGGTVQAKVKGRLSRFGKLGRAIIGLAKPFKANHRRMRKLERQVVEDPKAICLCVSEMIATEYETCYHRRDCVRVLYNAVDVPVINGAGRAAWRKQKRAEISATPDDLVLLCVAQNFRLKGVARTIKAFGRWYHSSATHNGARLVVAGRTASWHHRWMVRKAGVAGRVIFPGPSKEIFKWYAAADACILLSWYDPCSLVVLEAARWGIPCITTAFNGATALLKEAGVLVPSPADTEAVVAGLDKLADPQQRQKMSRVCLAMADQLSTDRYIEQLLELYGQVLKR
jgi:UDP-glucose:(heptosyl)LPS alpha-1,3-glucosyltransferase